MSHPDPTKTYEDETKRTWEISDKAINEKAKNHTDNLQVFGVISREHHSEVRRLVANEMKELLEWFVDYFQVEGNF